MAKRVVTATYIGINFGGSGISSYAANISEATLAMEAAKVDATSFDDGGWEAFLSGLKSANVTFNLRKDSDLSGLDLEAWTDYESGADVPTELRGTSAAASSTNAEYQFSFKVMNWSPIIGSVGSLFEESVTWPVNAPGGGVASVIRATS